MIEADDAIHHVANFVADIGQELAFRPVGGLCPGTGFLKLHLLALE